MHGLDKEPPLSMLVLSEKTTDAEKPAIAKWHEIVAAHKNKAVAFAQKYYPLQAGIVETAYANLISLIAELYGLDLSTVNTIDARAAGRHSCRHRFTCRACVIKALLTLQLL